MPGPLSHIRVLDLSRVLAGPWTGQLLADLGADVIKVERPVVGDDTRSWGPPFLKNPDGTDSNNAAYYLAMNRGKRSITLDLSKAEDQQVVRELARRSDILLENYKFGTLARFGLSYDDLKAVNPRLIYCSITGFGQTGPKRDVAAYDFMMQAMGGLMSVTGERDGLPGAGPQKVGLPIVDLMTGMYAGVAVLAALARRSETGQGDYIDIGMLDVLVATLSNQAMNYLISGKTPVRRGNRHPNIQPQDVFATRNGFMALAVGNDGQFVKLCDVIGKPEWARDVNFATNAARVRNESTLTPLLKSIFAAKDTSEWMELLEAAGVPSGPINTIPDVFNEPQVVDRQMKIELDHPVPESGKVPLVASPMRFRESPLSFRQSPPTLGQHTEEILRELGLKEEVKA